MAPAPKVILAFVLAILAHTRPRAETLNARPRDAAFPKQFLAQMRKPISLDWRADEGRRVDDLLLATIRWSKDRGRITHLGILGAWLRLPAKGTAGLMVMGVSLLSVAAFSFNPALAFRHFSPPHDGFSRPASFLLAPFSMRSIFEALFSCMFILGCGDELERTPGSTGGALCLYVTCGMFGHLVSTRVLDDRNAASVSGPAARLGWIAAVAARRPKLIFYVYSFQLYSWQVVILELGMFLSNTSASAGNVVGMLCGVAMGAAAGYQLEHGADGKLTADAASR